MTTDTQVKPSTTVSVNRDDRDRSILVLDMVDGEGSSVRLRYPLPDGGGRIAFDGGDRTVANGPFRVKIWSFDYHVLTLTLNLGITLDKAVAIQIAEILLGGPLPDAPHKCSAPGCTHGHGA